MTEEMIHEARFSVLLLQDSGGVGTGFVISPTGHILTCNHVVMGEMVQVDSPQGSYWTVPVLVRDPSCDLAMLWVKVVDGPPMCFADPTSIAEGQTVFALGHPLGFNFTVSLGVVWMSFEVNPTTQYYEVI